MELFTAEGCSSCPPADEWFSGLKKIPGLWKAFVPVTFHVDYWDRLGWKDPWGNPIFTKRQRDYVASWKTDSTYTPMIILDGKEFRDWYKTPTLKLKPKKNAGILKVRKISGTDFEVTFLPPNGRWMQDLKVSAAYLGFEIESRVKSGENNGNTLKHDFSALDFVETPLGYQQGYLKTTVHFDPKNKDGIARYGIAVWVTQGARLEPVQAIGGFLE